MGSTFIIVVAWTLSCNRISVQIALSETEYIYFWTMWQWRKLRQLTGWKKSWRNLGLKEQNEKPQVTRTYSTTPRYIHLLSLDLPRGNYWKPFSCFFWLFSCISKKKKKMPKLLLEFSNLDIVHYFLFKQMLLVLLHSISLTSTPFNIITSQFLINYTSVLSLLWLCKYF